MAFAVTSRASAVVAAGQTSPAAGRRSAAHAAVVSAPLRTRRSFAARQNSLSAAGRRVGARASVNVRAAAVEEGLQTPHGGVLVDLMVPESEQANVKASATKTMELSDRGACDVELLVVGGFSPMTGFVSEADYNSIVTDMKMTDGTIFGLPIVLDTDCEDVAVGDTVLLTYKGEDIAVLTVSEKYLPNKPLEALNCYGTSSLEHPGVQMIAMERGKYYLSGAVQGLKLPTRVFPCASPAEVRATLPAGKDVVAFQCRNPIHRAHYELFTRALDAENVGEGAVCLVHPTCGPTQQDDIPGIVRFRTYEVLKEEVNNPQIRWAYLPYSMHMAGPREAIQHMIIRKNYGCTHFIIGRDMAGSKSSITGDDFYGAYDAQDLAKATAAELNMQTVPSLNITYTEEKGYVTADVAKAEGLTTLSLSGTKFRKMLRGGDDIPEWFAFKSVVKVLREA
uniref:sulfate adenylyltransferase n=1 Tax=Tetraselmis chuii TaxID=63592 RepID=A0A7S1SQR5_9CHLO|mmetsp:Transcript_24589/g.43784  ORF Transcript_24589/g.43784 Transcript_24589/m.43784 type:complete len:451 (+) Transcript_24589:109-1461(+)